MMRSRTALFILLGAFAALMSTACATVQPWQRGTLADPLMMFDPDSTTAYMTHWQESREGSMGGYGVQGGGCGCK